MLCGNPCFPNVVTQQWTTDLALCISSSPLTCSWLHFLPECHQSGYRSSNNFTSNSNHLLNTYYVPDIVLSTLYKYHLIQSHSNCLSCYLQLQTRKLEPSGVKGPGPQEQMKIVKGQGQKLISEIQGCFLLYCFILLQKTFPVLFNLPPPSSLT